MDFNQQNSPNTAENFIRSLWTKYVPYWPFFLVLFVLFFFGAWFYLKKTTPLYKATATLLIKDEKKGIDDSRIIESLNLLSTKKIVENEIEVLGSRSLMAEVVDNLKLYAPVSQESKWRNASAYSISPIKIDVAEPSSITENPKISFRYDGDTKMIMIGKDSFPVNHWTKTPFGTLKFIPREVADTVRGKKFFFSLVKPKQVVLRMMSRLDATPSSKLSTVIDLEFKDEDPELAEDVLNELILAYNRAAVNDKNALAANTLSFVQERLSIVGHHLDSIEKKIEKYKAERGAVDISSQGKLFLENVSANDRKVADVNLQLAVLGQVEKYVSSKDNNGGIVPSTLGTLDPLLSSLLNKLYETELEKEKVKNTVGENSPMMVSLTDQIEKIKPSILENIQSQRRSLEASRANLGITSSGYSSILQTIPQKERDLVEISRQQNIENNIYAFLLQKREEAALSKSSTVADNRVVDNAQASLSPVSPNRMLIYAASIFIAFGLGIVCIAAKDLFNRTILYRSEIEHLTSAPILGEIGFEKSKNPIVIQDGTTSLVAEHFRKLRASLGFIGIGEKRKRILVTSTISGEGKSFIVANLGLSLALTGKKVVLLEADLSNPSLSEKFNIQDEKGLSGYLSGQYEADVIIKRTKLNDNLFVMPAGPFPPNPSELFTNGKMEELLVYLSEIFDYVLVDTAPVGAISDAYVLTRLCDATLYVIRHGRTPKIAVERLDKNNQINELKKMAIVFNGVRTRGFSQRSYGDGNNYGYLYNRKQKKKKHLT